MRNHLPLPYFSFLTLPDRTESQIDFELINKSDSWGALFATKGNRHRLACGTSESHLLRLHLPSSLSGGVDASLSTVALIGVCQNLSGTAIIAYYYTGILKSVCLQSAFDLEY